MDPLTRKKYIIYGAIGIAVLVLLGFLGSRFFRPGATQPPQAQPGVSGRPVGGTAPGRTPSSGTAPGATTTMLQLPSVVEKKLVQLTDFSVISPSLNKDETHALFYKKDGGDLWGVLTRGGEHEKIARVTVIGILEAVWSRAREVAAVFYISDQSIKGFLHVSTSSIAVLPQDIQSFSWSPDGKFLAYALEKEDLLHLVIADSSGRNPKTVFQTPITDAVINWISSDRIAFQSAPSGTAEGFIFIFSRSNGSFTRVLGPMNGLSGNWSPDGLRVLIMQTRSGGKYPTNAVYDTTRKELKTIDIATLPEKCAWSDTTEVYCAVPRDIPRDIILPDAYLRGEFNSSDRIVRIDTKSGLISPIFDEGSFDMSNLVVTKNKELLLFVSRRDGMLWSLKLK